MKRNSIDKFSNQPTKKQKTKQENDWIEINTKISTLEFDAKKQKIEKQIPPLLKKLKLCSESIEIESKTIHQIFHRLQNVYRSGPIISKTRSIFHTLKNKEALFQFHESIQKQILDQLQLRGTLLSKIAYLPSMPTQLFSIAEQILRACEAFKSLLFSLNEICSIYFAQSSSQFTSTVGFFNFYLIIIAGFSKIKCIVKEYLVLLGQVYQLLREDLFVLLPAGVISSKIIEQFPSQIPKYYIEGSTTKI